MSDPTNPPILTYDTAPKRKSPSRTVIVGYWCGLAIPSALYGIVLYIATRNGMRSPALGPANDAVIFPSIYFLFEILFGTLFLGLSLWIKTKIVKEVAFSPFRTALCWGVSAGIVSPILLILTADKSSESTAIALALAVLAWHCLFPIIAGQFLCYRTHLRD